MTDRTQPLRTPRTPQGEARKQAGLSLRQVEDATGINRGMISMWERGRLLLTLEQVQKISEVYEATEAA